MEKKKQAMSASDEPSLDDLDQPVQPNDLALRDEMFLANSTADTSTSCSEDQFITWWWTVMFMILVIGFLTYATICIVKGYRRRQEYSKFGYHV